MGKKQYGGLTLLKESHDKDYEYCLVRVTKDAMN